MKLGSQKQLRVGHSLWAQALGRFDWILFFLVSFVAACGLLNLYSATLGSPHSVKFDQQTIWLGVGAFIFLCLTLLDYRMFFRVVWVGLIAVVITIVMVKLFSNPIKGSTRWLIVGGIRIQPSELAKIALILATGRILQESQERGGRWFEHLPKVAILAIPILMVLWQPDLGSASLCLLIVGSMGFLMAKTLWPLVTAVVLGIASLPLFWQFMHEYQRGRVRTFLGMTDDPTGASWQTDQSINAVGSGQWTGKGFQNATQNQFEFLPEHWTDFPYSVWAEEWGFVGSVALLGLFFFLILWIITVGLNARDRFGQAICVGVAAMIFWHVLVNVLMVLGFAPVVGVTLPFISYGGSSLITFFIALGLVSSVSARRLRH